MKTPLLEEILDPPLISDRIFDFRFFGSFRSEIINNSDPLLLAEMFQYIKFLLVSVISSPKEYPDIVLPEPLIQKRQVNCLSSKKTRNPAKMNFVFALH